MIPFVISWKKFSLRVRKHRTNSERQVLERKMGSIFTSCQKIQTRYSWVRSANATSVLCRPPNQCNWCAESRCCSLATKQKLSFCLIVAELAGIRPVYYGSPCWTRASNIVPYIWGLGSNLVSQVLWLGDALGVFGEKSFWALLVGKKTKLQHGYQRFKVRRAFVWATHRKKPDRN